MGVSYLSGSSIGRKTLMVKKGSPFSFPFAFVYFFLSSFTVILTYIVLQILALKSGYFSSGTRTMFTEHVRNKTNGLFHLFQQTSKGLEFARSHIIVFFKLKSVVAGERAKEIIPKDSALCSFMACGELAVGRDLYHMLFTTVSEVSDRKI